MIVVREVFQLHFGKARPALALFKEMNELMAAAGMPQPRYLTDVVGPYYTIVMESEHESLSAFENSMSSDTGGDRWREVYAKIVPLVMEGRREIYRLVE